MGAENPVPNFREAEIPPAIVPPGGAKKAVPENGTDLEMEKQQFETQIASCLTGLKSVCRKLLWSSNNLTEDTEELVQETLKRAWHSRKSYKGEISDQRQFFAWLYRIASNAAIDRARHLKNDPIRKAQPLDGTQFMAPPDSGGEEDIIGEILRRQQRSILEKYISRLGKKSRAVVLLWLENASYQEIAEKIGIDLNTAKTRLSRAKKRLLKLALSNRMPEGKTNGSKEVKE